MRHCRSHQSPGLLRGGPVHLPVYSQTSPEVPAGHPPAASPHHGHHPPAPRHHHHVRHVTQGLPGEIPRQQSRAAGSDQETWETDLWPPVFCFRTNKKMSLFRTGPSSATSFYHAVLRLASSSSWDRARSSSYARSYLCPTSASLSRSSTSTMTSSYWRPTLSLLSKTSLFSSPARIYQSFLVV